MDCAKLINCMRCGSTYNIEKPELADLILHRKLDTIRATGADVVVTGNPGCMLQLKEGFSCFPAKNNIKVWA